MVNSIILSSGCYVPDNVIYNEDLKQFPKNLLPFIASKTGVKARRFVVNNMCTSDIAIIAGNNCLKNINFNPLSLDAIILATSSPDRFQPATATRVQNGIGAKNAFAFDINSVCAGGIFALAVADSFIRAGVCENILVIAAEIYSKFLDPTDFSTFPYFGDGSGSVLLSSSANSDKGIIFTKLKTDGSMADVIQVPAGGTMLPYYNLQNPKDIFFKMIGREVYNFAVDKGAEIINEVLYEANIDKNDLRFIIAHQANINIIKDIANKLEININKFIINLDKYGNTAAASVFIALHELLNSTSLREGDLVILVAFGGGLSWGATLLKF